MYLGSIMNTLCTHFLFLYTVSWGCGNQEKPHKPGFSKKTYSSNEQGSFTIFRKTLVVKIWFFSSCKREKKPPQIVRKSKENSPLKVRHVGPVLPTLSTYQVYDLHETEVELNQEGVRVVDDGSVQRVVASEQILQQPALVWPLNRICTYRGEESSSLLLLTRLLGQPFMLQDKPHFLMKCWEIAGNIVDRMCAVPG